MNYPNEKRSVNKSSNRKNSPKGEMYTPVGELKWSKADEAHVLSDMEGTAITIGSPDKKLLNEKIVRYILKMLCVPLILVVVLVTGLLIGHSVIGGQPAGDVFDINMWQHLYRLIFT
jgi:hypothetical protein